MSAPGRPVLTTESKNINSGDRYGIKDKGFDPALITPGPPKDWSVIL